MARFWAACCLLVLFWLPSLGLAEGVLPLPPLTGRIVDLTGTLGAEQKSALESISLRLEQQSGAQLGVLLLPSTRPESIEQFGIRLAESWKLGRKGVDDGLIIIVAKDDRRMRIEVGYGLEGVIPDAIAKRIISEQMMPRFKEADFAGGLTAAMNTLTEHIVDKSQVDATRPTGDVLPAPSGAPATPADKGLSTLAETPIAAQTPSATQAAPAALSSIKLSPDLLLLVLAGGAVIGHLLRRFIGNLFGTASMAGVGGFVGWWLLGGFPGLILGVVLAVLVAIFGLDLIFAVLSARSGGGSGGRSGGFGGGGGGFGGGGASGNW